MPHLLKSHSHEFFLETPLASECGSEQDAMRVLGYTQASWDNLSGEEQQPWSSIKYWSSLTPNEKEAAVVLGYTEMTWHYVFSMGRHILGKAPLEPLSAIKYWDELTPCGEGENAGCHSVHPRDISRCFFIFIAWRFSCFWSLAPSSVHWSG